jgi:phenylacetate-CoA ligase
MTSLMKERVGPFYDSWEVTTKEKKEPILKNLLHEYILHAKKLPFYQERLSQVHREDLYPLKNVVPLNSGDLRAQLPPLGSGLMANSDRAFTVFQSGGTTGTPKTSLFTHDELEGLNHLNARGFYATGLRETDRVANLWAVGGLYMTFVHINRMLQQYGCENFPFSNQTPVDFIYTVAKQFNINVFTGITSVVLNSLRDIHRKDSSLKVEKIYYGGEHIYEADRIEMKSKVGVDLIAAPGYGTVDTWYLGYQCDHSMPGEFHAHDDQVYLEIVNEATGIHCRANEVGMLYATAFPRRLTPIVRYMVGDRAEWLDEACKCGRTTPKFRLLGRGDDVLRIGYDSIDYAAIQALVTKISGLTGMVQMQKTRVDGRDLLTIRVEAELAVSDFDRARDALTELILSDRPSLREFVKKGTIEPLKVDILKAGTLPLNPRTGKLVRVIDAL